MRAAVARLMCVAIFCSVTGFAALELVAMSLYPGGTWWDSRAQGARFWENFLCDLEWRVALNGTPNPVGSRVALAAMIVLALGLGPFWLASAAACAPAAVTRARLPAAVRLLGVSSAVGTIAVVLMPSDRFGAAHGAAVIVAGLPGLAAAGLAVLGMARSGPRLRVTAWIGGSMLVFGFFDFVLYASHLATHTEGTPLVAAVEKVALGLLLAWMLAVARRAWAG
jgi:hypothetical protein